MTDTWIQRFRRGVTLQQVVAYGALLTVVVLVAYPMAFLSEIAFRVSEAGQPALYGLGNFAMIFSPGNRVAIMNTMVLAVVSTVIAIPCGFIAAWIVFRTDVPGRRFFERLLVLPYYMTPLVPTLAWLALASPRSGLINQIGFHMGLAEPIINISSLGGISFVMAMTGAAVAFVIMGGALQLLNPSLEEASQLFGASKTQTLMRITIPLMLPAILSATIFVLAEGLGAFAEPLVLGATGGIETISTKIYLLVGSYPPAYGEAAALGIALLLVVGPLMYLYFRLLKGRDFSTVSGKSFRRGGIEVRRSKYALLAAVGGFAALAVVLPILTLIMNSVQRLSTVYIGDTIWTLEHYRKVLTSPDFTSSMTNSLILGVGTATSGVLLMGFVVWLIYRSPIPPAIGRGIEYVVMMPVAIPRLVFAFGLLWAWLQFPGKMYGTLWILWLAYLTVFLPLGVRTIASVVLQLDKSLEEAAKVLGAGRFYMIRTVTAPLLKPGLIAAWLLMFIVSVRELGASILLVGPDSRVISPSIVEAFQISGREPAATLAVIQLIVVLGALLLMLRLTEAEKA